MELFVTKTARGSLALELLGMACALLVTAFQRLFLFD